MKRNDQRNKNLKPNRGSFTPSKQVLTDENCVPSFNCLQKQMKTEREREIMRHAILFVRQKKALINNKNGLDPMLFLLHTNSCQSW